MTIETDWTHLTTDIPDQGLHVRRNADKTQIEALTAKLGLLEIEVLQADYRIRPGRAGSFVMTGELTARVQQECSVSLEPVTSLINEPLKVEFRPPSHMPAQENVEHEAIAVPDIEPIEQQLLDVGRIIAETLAAALDPYPRAPDAKFDWHDETEPKKDGEAGVDGPFAALSRLRPKSD